MPGLSSQHEMSHLWFMYFKRGMTQNEKIRTKTCSFPLAAASLAHKNPVIPHNVLHCAVFLSGKEAFPATNQPLEVDSSMFLRSKSSGRELVRLWDESVRWSWPLPGAITLKNYSLYSWGKHSAAVCKQVCVLVMSLQQESEEMKVELKWFSCAIQLILY